MQQLIQAVNVGQAVTRSVSPAHLAHAVSLRDWSRDVQLLPDQLQRRESQLCGNHTQVQREEMNQQPLTSREKFPKLAQHCLEPLPRPLAAVSR